MAAEARVQWNQLQNSQWAVCWHLTFTLSPLLLQSKEILFPKPLYPISTYCCITHWGMGLRLQLLLLNPPWRGAREIFFALIAARFPRKHKQNSGELWWGSRYHDKFGALSSPGEWNYKDSRTCRPIPGAASEHMRTVCYFPSLLPIFTCCTGATQPKPCDPPSWCCPSQGLCIVHARRGIFAVWHCCAVDALLDAQDFQSLSGPECYSHTCKINWKKELQTLKASLVNFLQISRGRTNKLYKQLNMIKVYKGCDFLSATGHQGLWNLVAEGWGARVGLQCWWHQRNPYTSFR